MQCQILFPTTARCSKTGCYYNKLPPFLPLSLKPVHLHKAAILYKGLHKAVYLYKQAHSSLFVFPYKNLLILLKSLTVIVLDVLHRHPEMTV